jgi:hypothetical protein
MKAEEENQQLKENKMPQVSPDDDHTTHIYTHYMVQPKTWATWFHIQWHEEELAKQKQQEQMMAQAEPTQTNPGAQKKSALQAATPLKTEINTNQNV